MKIKVLSPQYTNPGDLSWGELEKLGECSFSNYDVGTPVDISEPGFKDTEVLVVGHIDVTKEVIDACPNLKFITTLSTGYNQVDLAYAKSKGILVSNVPTYGTASVAQHSIALLLEIANRVGHHSSIVARGEWTMKRGWTFWDYPLLELAGKTMGIIGFGRIGQQEGRIARALGMKVIAYDLYENASGREIGEYVGLEELYRTSDVISLHCNLTKDNENMINVTSITKMKDGVIIINDARGGLIVEKDLAEALHSGKVYAAGLDVTEEEPINPKSPLLSAPNCIITPHNAWCSRESRERIISIATENVKAFKEGNPRYLV